MKVILSLFLAMIVGLVSLYAEEGARILTEDSSKMITLRVEDMDFNSALGFIEKLYDVKFQVKDRALNSRKVTVDFQGVPLDEALTIMCAQIKAEYKVSKVGEFVISQKSNEQQQ